MNREAVPNLVPARCCGECVNGNAHEDTPYVYCRKYHDVVYATEVCSEFKDSREKIPCK